MSASAIRHRGAQLSDRDGAGSVGVEPIDYKAPVEGPTFNTTRGKGITNRRCHKSSHSGGEYSSRLHTVVQEIV